MRHCSDFSRPIQPKVKCLVNTGNRVGIWLRGLVDFPVPRSIVSLNLMRFYLDDSRPNTNSKSFDKVR